MSIIPRSLLLALAVLIAEAVIAPVSANAQYHRHHRRYHHHRPYRHHHHPYRR